MASARNSLVAVAFKQPRLMASVLCCDVTAIRNTVERYKGHPLSCDVSCDVSFDVRYLTNHCMIL